MSNPYRRQPTDKVTVHPQVLRAIVRTAVLGVAGVEQVGQKRFGMTDEGIKISLDEDQMSIVVQVMVNLQHPLSELCHNVQKAVDQTLEAYVGVKTRRVDVYILDFVFGGSEQET